MKRLLFRTYGTTFVNDGGALCRNVQGRGVYANTVLRPRFEERVDNGAHTLSPVIIAENIK